LHATAAPPVPRPPETGRSPGRHKCPLSEPSPPSPAAAAAPTPARRVQSPAEPLRTLTKPSRRVTGRSSRSSPSSPATSPGENIPFPNRLSPPIKGANGFPGHRTSPRPPPFPCLGARAPPPLTPPPPVRRRPWSRPLALPRPKVSEGNKSPRRPPPFSLSPLASVAGRPAGRRRPRPARPHPPLICSV
jgi:hypothetical protein